MTSFDYRLNPIYAIKECSSCGSLYTSNCGCSKGSPEDKILVPKPPRNCERCAKCGIPVDGPYCQGCALLRKEFMEGLLTNCVGKNEFFKDFQDIPSRLPTTIPTLLSSSRANRYQSGPRMEMETTINVFKLRTVYDFQVLQTHPPTTTNALPLLSIVIKSSVENLIQSKRKSEVIPDNVCVCAFVNNPTSLEAFKEHSETITNYNNDNSSSDDDSTYGEDIEYVDASPPDVEIVSLEVVDVVDPEVGRIDDDILLH
ncbi:hypothetical protein Tco_1134946 [Tanacetum coccineum]